MNLQINLEEFSDDQLAVFHSINPEAVDAERLRRFAFESVEYGIDVLYENALILEKELANRKSTLFITTVLEPLLETIQRLMVTSGKSMTVPPIKPASKPVGGRKPRKAAEKKPADA
ncbi:MAG: hypothetical protein GC184_06075 [Rhizobiales bacterium]|nr:hypothetical protein [Hyphomicrobiales bacterium]